MDRLHLLCVYKSYCHVDIRYYELKDSLQQCDCEQF